LGEVKIKAEHVNPFIVATMETFTSMVRVKVTPGKVKLKAGDPLSYDISGIIGLSGGAKGSVALSFPWESANAIVKAFIGVDRVDDAAVIDAVGELANVIAGAAKKDLSQHNISISLPTVVTGKDHGINGPVDTVNMVVPFESEHGRFDLAISFKSLP
jgi:chemotaxis protein CheX